ncbi:MAG: hypothetical protein AB6733_07760 [Clostridiaceae bacterium]
MDDYGLSNSIAYENLNKEIKIKERKINKLELNKLIFRIEIELLRYMGEYDQDMDIFLKDIETEQNAIKLQVLKLKKQAQIQENKIRRRFIMKI